MNTLHLVTPVTRPWHLAEIARSVQAARGVLPIVWYVLPDGVSISVPDALELPFRAGCCWGLRQNNYALERLTDAPGWVYFLSDDNLLHPSLPPFFASSKPDHVALFPQLGYDDSVVRTMVSPPREAGIDIAQWAVPRQWATEARFNPDRYEGDWDYLSALLARRPYRWHPHTWSYFNALTTSTTNHPGGG